jgi:pectate lyase
MPVSRQDRASILLLTLPLLVWSVVILYLCRVTGFVLDRLLLTAPGIYVSYAVLALCPLAAVAVGWRLAAKRRLWGRSVMSLGGIMTAAFVVVIGIPLVQQFLDEETPRNPGSPRPLEALVGLPVFPGAEGFGTRTPAGRGGKLIEVTSLADSGPGTLRAALDTPGPRIIVFRTGGTIELQSELYLLHPFVTVAGQTAPGGGICIKNCGLVIAAHDVLFQHVRFRPGKEGDTEADDNDAIKIFGPRGTFVGAKNVVLDHISASWSEDEVISTWFGPREITICWSIISEGLNRSRHRKGTHSSGLLIGDSTDHVSVHHNLLAHNSFRNPLIVGGGTHDIVNNVVYNWGDLPAEVQDMNSNSFLNFVSNKFIAGPSSVLPQDAIIVHGTEGTPRLYVDGNLSARRPTDDVDQWAVVTQEWHGTTASLSYRASKRFAAPHVTASSADEALSQVLEQAGATRPQRDAVDRRVVSDVMSGTGAVIDSPSQVGGYPQLARGGPPRDTDHDGMPDAWEQQMDLDPHDPSDANQTPDANGYTNIELYLHSLCQPT